MKLSRYEDLETNKLIYTLEVGAREYADVRLTHFDEVLIDDIEHGEPSDTPIADQLLGLETIARRIEEQQSNTADRGRKE